MIRSRPRPTAECHLRAGQLRCVRESGIIAHIRGGEYTVQVGRTALWDVGHARPPSFQTLKLVTNKAILWTFWAFMSRLRGISTFGNMYCLTYLSLCNKAHSLEVLVISFYDLSLEPWSTLWPGQWAGVPALWPASPVTWSGPDWWRNRHPCTPAPGDTRL